MTAEEHGDAVEAAARPASWAWAISSAPGSRDFEAVVQAAHSRRLDALLGRAGLNQKGGVTALEPRQWCRWQADGTYRRLKE